MPTVPRVTVPQTEQQPLPGGGRGSLATRSLSGALGAFGAGEAEGKQELGKSLAHVGDVLADAYIRMRNRQDAVQRAKDFETYRTSLRDEFLAVERDGDNFASVDSVRAFSEKANENMEKMLADHPGSKTSQAILHEMMIQERFQFNSAAVARSVKTQADLVDRQISDYISQQSDMASAAPDTLPELFADFEIRLKNYEGTLSEGQLDVKRRVGHDQMLQSAMESMLLTGNTQKASEVLTASASMVSPETARRLRNKIIAMDTEINKRKAETAAAIQTLKNMGVSDEFMKDPRVAMALVGINLPSDPRAHPSFEMQVQDGIAALEKAQGGPATPKQKMEVFNAIVLKAKASDIEPLFGKSEKGLARQHIVDLAPKIAAGADSPYERRTFLQAVAAITAPDPVTGLPGILSPDAVTALAMANIDASRLQEPDYIEQIVQQRPGALGIPRQPGQPAQGTQPAQPTQPQAQPSTGRAPVQGTQLEQEARAHTEEVLQREQASSEGQEVGQAFTSLSEFEQKTRTNGEAGGMLHSEAGQPPVTLFDAANLLTGPISGTRQAVSGTAFIGEVFPANEVRQARRFMESFKHDFVTVLQNNPKYPEGEREAILKSLDIESKFLGEPAAFQQDLIGLDEFLAVREQNARNTVNSGRVSKDVRAAALNILNAIGNARRVIGVPPLFSTPQEAQQAVQEGRLKPGQKFRTKSGRQFRVPSGQSAQSAQ